MFKFLINFHDIDWSPLLFFTSLFRLQFTIPIPINCRYVYQRNTDLVDVPLFRHVWRRDWV